ncbi:MAG: LytTR family DNA-binding domain-containing protein [Bacteroidales bacterium]|nr:LytTR family DNA-binding domain-containing protein [Bacteroidales bacterium]
MERKTTIILPTKDGREIVNAEDIISVCSNNKSVIVEMEGNKKFEARLGIGSMYDQLDQQYFIRCHRTCIVNLVKIKKIRGPFNSFIMCDGNEKPIAKASKKSVKEYFNQFYQR